MKNLLGKKLHLGRLGVPMWTIGLAGVMVAAVAGQAVGPVLSGSVQGSAGLVVSQTVVLSAAPATAYTNDDFAATMNDEGTAFTVAIETQVGQESGFKLTLANNSGKLANAILELSVPAGVDVEVADTQVAGTDDLSEAQLNRNTWLLTVAASNDDTLDIKVESKDDAAPGFYTITGRIIQVAN